MRDKTRKLKTPDRIFVAWKIWAQLMLEYIENERANLLCNPGTLTDTIFDTIMHFLYVQLCYK